MVIEAQLDEDGTLHDPVVIQKTGDPRLIEVAKELVAAIGDSKVLGFMKKDARRLRITVKLIRTRSWRRLNPRSARPNVQGS